MEPRNNKRTNDGEIIVQAPLRKKPTQHKNTCRRSPSIIKVESDGEDDQHAYVLGTPDPTPIELQRRLNDHDKQFARQGEQLTRILQHLEGDQRDHRTHIEDLDHENNVSEHRGNTPNLFPPYLPCNTSKKHTHGSKNQFFMTYLG